MKSQTKQCILNACFYLLIRESHIVKNNIGELLI